MGGGLEESTNRLEQGRSQLRLELVREVLGFLALAMGCVVCGHAELVQRFRERFTTVIDLILLQVVNGSEDLDGIVGFEAEP